MKKFTLSVALFLSLLKCSAQETTTEDSSYTTRKLSFSEANFVSGYYQQDGEHSAVTGGIGSEKLTDISNSIELRWNKTDHFNRTHLLSVEAGIDSYTSASSDKIDPTTVSSASSKDTRYYPSGSYTISNNEKHLSYGFLGSISKEYDYTSIGVGGSFSKSSKDNNRELTVKALAFFDTWKVILPIELSDKDISAFTDNDTRNSYNLSLVYSQVINKRMTAALLSDIGMQQGLLSTLYQRIYFQDGSEWVEQLPESRVKIPIGLRVNYFAGDKVVLRTYYRYYTDDWGISSNTVSLEVPVKITNSFTVGPFGRLYNQTASTYFKEYGQHLPTEEFYTSDHDLSAFSSQYYALNFRFMLADGIMGIRHWNAVEVRAGHYTRSDGLASNAITAAFKFK
jgi:hypothetical protein